MAYLESTRKDKNGNWLPYYWGNDVKVSNQKILLMRILDILKTESSEYNPISLDEIVDILEQKRADYSNGDIPKIHYESRSKAKDCIGKELNDLIHINPQIKKVGSKYYADLDAEYSLFCCFAIDSIFRQKNIEIIQSNLDFVRSHKSLNSVANLDYCFLLNPKPHTVFASDEFPDLTRLELYSSLNRYNIEIDYREKDGEVSKYKLAPLCVIFYMGTPYLIALRNDTKNKSLCHFDIDEIKEVSQLEKIKPNSIQKFINKQCFKDDTNELDSLIMIFGQAEKSTKEERRVFYKYFMDNVCSNIKKITFEFDVDKLSPTIVEKEFGKIIFTPISEPKCIDITKIKAFTESNFDKRDIIEAKELIEEVRQYTNFYFSNKSKEILHKYGFLSIEEMIKNKASNSKDNILREVLEDILVRYGNIYISHHAQRIILAAKKRDRQFPDERQTTMCAVKTLSVKCFPLISERKQGRLSVTVKYPIEDFLSWAIKYSDKITIKNKEIFKEFEKRCSKLKSSCFITSDDDEIEEVYIQLLNFKNEQLINKAFDTELMIVDANEKIYKFKTNSINIKDIVEYAILNPNILRIHPRSDTAYDELQDKLRYLDKAYDDEF